MDMAHFTTEYEELIADGKSVRRISEEPLLVKRETYSASSQRRFTNDE
jgi:hypothetical protein